MQLKERRGCRVSGGVAPGNGIGGEGGERDSETDALLSRRNSGEIHCSSCWDFFCYSPSPKWVNVLLEVTGSNNH